MADYKLKNGNTPHKLTDEERRKGGAKTAQKWKERKSLQELAQILLGEKPNDNIALKLEKENLPITREMAYLLSIYNNGAAKGSIEALQFLEDLANGDNSPTENPKP